MKFKKRLRVSEMARLAKLNTRTLHYYDEIGLFSPESKGENGYRYYSLEQLVDLGIILSLKELDMPLKEISSVLTGDIEASKKVLEKKRTEIDEKIQNLTDMKQIIERRLLSFETAVQHNTQIRSIDLDEEYLILSEKIEKATSQNIIETAYKLFTREGKYFFANNEYGSMLHHQKEDGKSYDYFFLKTDKRNNYNFVKPGGRYLQYIYKGDDKGLIKAYDKIRTYAVSNHLNLDGYFYEKALNETISSNQTEYVTEIQIKVI